MKNILLCHLIINTSGVPKKQYLPIDTIPNYTEVLSEYFNKRTSDLILYVKETSCYSTKVIKNFKKQRSQPNQAFLKGNYFFFENHTEQSSFFLTILDKIKSFELKKK